TREFHEENKAGHQVWHVSAPHRWRIAEAGHSFLPPWDPEYYRGRPAGFYEIYENADSVGIIVQKLSNKLDAGEVLVRGYSKVHHHSYKKTSRNFYLNSVVLLRKA
ncbi:hypothetical protein AAIH11_35115, partial [Pseudomonas aeruginosa]